MRILLVNYEYPPTGGGAATATKAIGLALNELGHEVVVLTGNCKGSSDSQATDGVVVHRLPSWRRRTDRSGVVEMASFLALGLTSAPGLIRRNHVDAMIVFFSMPCGPIALVGHWITGVPYIVSLRGGDVPGNESSLGLLHQLLAPVRRAVMRKSVAIVANSAGLRKAAEAVDPFPVHVIPNGIDTDFFRPAERNGSGRPITHALRILFVGRFNEQKNVGFLLRELTELEPGSFELHLVGDGPLASRLRSATEQFGLAGAVTWHGWRSRSELLGIYQSADCLVNPSLYEGMPNVVLEAMACGLPVVASNVSGNGELILDGETGFLFDLEQPRVLGNILLRLTGDRSLCAKLGSNARARAVQHFSWRTVAEHYLRLFTEADAQLRK